MFKKLDDLDLGCGVASGKDTKGVFKVRPTNVFKGVLTNIDYPLTIACVTYRNLKML